MGRLTPKGQATRNHILRCAADLILERGVHGTNNEELRRSAGVSGSQLSRYFPDKESLVEAVITWRADEILAAHTDGRFGALDSIQSLRDWAAHYIAYDAAYRAGCSLGSLAAEVLKSDLAVRDHLRGQFERWTELFRTGLSSMRERGELRPEADPEQLATLLMAAFQGSMFLAQVQGENSPVKSALVAAVDHIESFVTVA